MMNKLTSCLLFIFAVGVGGCNSMGPTADSIVVKQLTTRALKDSRYTLVTATLDYTFVSAPDATIALGLDNEVPGRIQMMAAKPIERGSGTVELSTEIELKSDRKTLSVLLSINQKQTGPDHRPYVVERNSLNYPQLNTAGSTPVNPAPLAAAPAVGVTK